jgi:hypothetical protein
MTYQIHTRQSLESLNLVQLKAIASQIGATPTDRRSIRSIRSHITAILEHQPQPVEGSIKYEVGSIKSEDPDLTSYLILNTSYSEVSEAILDELEITFIDLSIGTDLVVPDGLDAYHAVYNDRTIVEVYNYKGGYVCRRGDGVVYDDPYSAIVNHYERYNPGAVLLARMSIERDKEIEMVRAAMMPEYA